MPDGLVKWFDRKKGFGFLTAVDGTDVFVHYASITGEGHRTLLEGSAVSFDIESTPKGPVARNVVIADNDGQEDSVS